MPRFHVSVCIATSGRPTVLTEILHDVAKQTRRPDRVFVCPAKPSDVDSEALNALPIEIEIVEGGIGLPMQRNALLRAAGSSDIILFVDDDFLLAPAYVEAMERLFDQRPHCVVATGTVLADGATGPGYSVAEGRQIIAARRMTGSVIAPVSNAYGCNMAVRWSMLHDRDCWFDENLPLYAWSEDVDFSRRAAIYGTVLKAETMVGVHLAAKHGRVSGVRFGYSQIANQVYLTRKGSITFGRGLRQACENIAANVVGTLLDNETYVDRRGRLVGNFYGLRDLFSGRVSPQRILDL